MSTREDKSLWTHTIVCQCIIDFHENDASSLIRVTPAACNKSFVDFIAVNPL